MMPFAMRARHLIGTLRWRFIHLAGRRAISPAEADRWLAGIARYAYSVASDLAALAYSRESDAKDFKLRNYRARLGQLHREMAAFEADVKATARAYAAKQHDRLPRRSDKLKLNLGSSGRPIEGWLSLDAKTGDVMMSLLQKLPFDDQSVDFAFMCHVLEHFYFPLEAFQVLREIRRVLKPGGVLRIVVPDIGHCMRAYISGDREFFIKRDKELFGQERQRNLLEYFLHYAGASSGPGHMFSHKYGYDFDTLSTLVKNSGFTPMPSEYMASTYPELRVDKFSRSARAEVDGRKLSLFMDAVVPLVE